MSPVKKIPVFLSIVIFILAGLRLALPEIALRLINKNLKNKLGRFEGSIGDFDLSLYRGAYRIQDLKLVKKGSGSPPLLEVDEIDLSISWKALFRKQISADVTVDGFTFHLLDSGEKKERQFGTEEPKKNWKEALSVVVPVHIENFRAHNGAIRFTHRNVRPPLPVRIDELSIEAENLRTYDDRGAPSPLRVQAKIQDHARLKIDGSIGVIADDIAVDLNLALEDFRLETINRQLRQYIPLDVNRGTLSVYSEFAYSDGQAIGYAKFFLENPDIIEPDQNYVSGEHVFNEVAAGLAAWFLENNKTETVATIIPFEYQEKKWSPNLDEAFWSALENKSDQLSRKLDDSVSASP